MQGTPKQSVAELPAYVGGTAAVRILCVEDDEHYRETLVAELSERGFAVRGFADATSLLGSLDSVFEADVIVLEWKLPSTSGVDLLHQLRRRGVNLPVIFLTAHTLVANESLAFDRGASDFIDKARGVDVLVSRLKRIVGTHKSVADRQTDKFMACGRLVLKPEISRAYWNGVDVGLTMGEYENRPFAGDERRSLHYVSHDLRPPDLRGVYRGGRKYWLSGERPIGNQAHPKQVSAHAIGLCRNRKLHWLWILLGQASRRRGLQRKKASFKAQFARWRAARTSGDRRTPSPSSVRHAPPTRARASWANGLRARCGLVMLAAIVWLRSLSVGPVTPSHVNLKFAA